MGNLEQTLLEEVPFEYNEDGECMYCGNMKALENENLELINKMKVMAIKVNDLRNLLEDLMNENQGYRDAIDRLNEYISHYDLAVRQFNNKNAN